MHLSSVIKQKSYEHIEYLLRRDVVTLLPSLFLLLLLIGVGLGVARLLQILWPQFFSSPIGFPIIVLAGSVYFLSLLLFVFTQFINYWLDMWIITNDRIVNIEQMGLFARRISELDLHRVQDVTSEVKGFFPTLFNFGTVYIQTAGTIERFVFEQIPNPHEIRKAILDLAEFDRRYHNQPNP